MSAHVLLNLSNELGKRYLFIAPQGIVCCVLCLFYPARKIMHIK